jgi:hypothetical protein
MKTAGNQVKRDRKGLTRCRVCGCTEVDACSGGCSWVPGEANLCTTCDETAGSMVVWCLNARRANMAGLMRELERQLGDARFLLTQKKGLATRQ